MKVELPETYQAEDLEEQARTALGSFVEQRLREGTAPYQAAFQESRQMVRRLFEATDNLRSLTPEVVQASPWLMEPARYLGGPPLSQDDLDTLAGGKIVGRKNLDAVAARQAIDAVMAFLDPFRCPWLAEDHSPTKSQIEAAIDWTASLWAVERCKTSRRGESSARQERAVAALFRRCGLNEMKGLKRIKSLDELPRNHFTREVILGNAKADLAVRLAEGRLLAVECKVSNSALNSVKRLNRETVGKADAWRTVYGQQVITVAVLAGVFKVSNLVDAQREGVFIIWDHDLSPLEAFVRRTTEGDASEAGDAG